jgi:hypothetical protein
VVSNRSSARSSSTTVLPSCSQSTCSSTGYIASSSEWLAAGS